MKKKLILFFLLFTVSLQASALIGLLVPGSRIVQAAFTTPAGQIYTTAALMAIGSLINSIQIARTGTDGSTRTDEFYQTNSPRQPSNIEAAAGFTPGFPSVTPPATVGPRTVVVIYGMEFASTTLACISVLGGNYTGGREPTFDVPGNCRNTDTGYLGYVDVYLVLKCPVGFSGTTSCNLVNPSAAARPVDGHCPIVRVNNAYSADAADPDCAGGAMPQFAADGSWSIEGADGRKVSGTMNAATGAGSITESVPDYNKGTTKTTTNTFKPDAAHPNEQTLIIGGSSVETVGVGDSATSTTVQPSAAPTDITPIVSAIGNQMAADAAREEARIAKENADRAIPAFTDVIPKESIPVDFSGVSFASAAVCPLPISFNMMGKNFSISYDAMCNLMALMRPLFLALGAFSAAFIFMGAFKV